MIGLLSSLLFLLLFAWVVRGLLGAREITWKRLIAAVLVGYSLGFAVAALLVIDLAELVAAPEAFGPLPETVLPLALPFQIVATMAAVVVFELLFPRARPVQARRRFRPFHAVRQAFRILLRMLRVSRIMARHGLAPLLGLRRGGVSAREPGELARRVRTALEEAGGMFIKLGQLLAARPDLLPPAALAELGRLHASARPLPRAEVEQVILSELGPLEAVFEEVDWEPLGSASIAQVHMARLGDGRQVVIKLRRPGLEDLMERDLAVLAWMARIAERRTDWGRVYAVTGLAGEFADTLWGELDFRNEAEAAAEMASAIPPERQVHVPEVLDEYTTERLLVMELLDGKVISSTEPATLGAEARALADDLCASQVGAMLGGKRFHGDPHPGNVMLLADGRLGLLDFGITGKLDAFERDSMFQMLLAIRLQQPQLLFESLVAVGAISPDRRPDDIERSLARFMAANLDADLPSAGALSELLRLTTRLGIRLPPQSATMFRALATLAGTLEHLVPGYPLIERVAELGGTEMRDRFAPASVADFVQREWTQLAPLMRRAPRHLDRIATQLEYGALTTRVRLFADPSDVGVVERLVNRSVLTILALGLGLLSVMMLGLDTGPRMAETEVLLVEALGWLGLFAGTVLLLRVLLDVLRSGNSP